MHIINEQQDMENDKLISFFLEHLVPIIFTFEKDGEIGGFVCTSFVLSVADHWFLAHIGSKVKLTEYNIYSQLPDTGRTHHTVAHSDHEWARDDDGDGIREVHCNTMEGIWTGLRNFLRPLRSVHKKYLAQYVAMFEWADNLKHVSADFLRALMIPGFAFFPI